MLPYRLTRSKGKENKNLQKKPTWQLSNPFETYFLALRYPKMNLLIKFYVISSHLLATVPGIFSHE